MYQDIFSFVTAEETSYNSVGVTIAKNWDWKMSDHIRRTILYKNSQYFESMKTSDMPFKNITRPILNLQYRAEGFDVKDIELFVDDKKDYYKSFLVRKFHDKWALENDLDVFIDKLVESYVDFGGALIKDVDDIAPEVVPLQRLAFVDQTDMLSGPICEKHYYSVEQLKKMSDKGWKNIETLIALSYEYKKDIGNSSKQTKTPSKYIEVYEVHGSFPEKWLEDYEDSDKYAQQIQICAFYTDKDDNKQGIVLFKGREKELPYKLILRDEIYGRALGLGGAEELFEPQVWVNYDKIKEKELLDQLKIFYQTSDKGLAARNKIKELASGYIFEHEDGKPLVQLPVSAVNVNAFENSVREWEEHAQSMGGAFGPLAGEEPSAGTPFKSLELQVKQGLALHEYRRGKLATFLAEVYRDWIIPYIASELSKGQGFLAELDLDELQAVTDNIVANETNKMVKEMILNGELVRDEDVEKHGQMVRESFMKSGNRKFIEIFKNELKDVSLSVRVNIVGKQKNLSQMTDKLVNIFRQILAAPQVLDDPRISKIFNEILENSGLSPVGFLGKPKLSPQPVAPQPQSVTT